MDKGTEMKKLLLLIGLTAASMANSVEVRSIMNLVHPGGHTDSVSIRQGEVACSTNSYYIISREGNRCVSFKDAYRYNRHTVVCNSFTVTKRR